MSLDKLIGISLERITADAAYAEALYGKVVQWIESNKPELLE